MNRWSSPTARAALALLLVLLLGCVCNGQGAFFRASLHLDLLGSISVVGLCALGQCVVILTGGIDLSVGAVLALTGMTFAGLTTVGDVGWPLAVAASLLLGIGLGLLNGWLVARQGIQPFLVTLAAMVIARGLARFVPAMAGKPPNSKFQPTDSLGPPFWQWLAGRAFDTVPVAGLLFAAVAVVLVVWLRRSVFGRHLFAVGGNREAARLSGVPVQRVTILAYAACSGLAALAGVCQVARDVHGNPGAGELLELQSIAAVVVGGTSLLGGRGGPGLAVLGVLTIEYVGKILSISGVEQHWRLIITGAIILAAVLLQDRRR
ncbi:MAG: ABC transporter permease [Planctomycetes bacterium]|nr:ABC transporter permease [Planctomycetota bacterium]